ARAHAVVAGHLVDLVDEHDAQVLGALHGLVGHLVMVDEAVGLLVLEDAPGVAHARLAARALLGHEALEHLLQVQARLLHAGQGHGAGRLVRHLDLDHALVELALAQQRPHALAALAAAARQQPVEQALLGGGAGARTMESTSRPTQPTAVNLVASTLRSGAPASWARRGAISVLPTPVGPIMRMFLGVTSRWISGGSRRRR